MLRPWSWLTLLPIVFGLITVKNGSNLVLPCDPAELLVRHHMAPDYTSPQLVRRLDWYQDDLRIASFQQAIMTLLKLLISYRTSQTLNVRPTAPSRPIATEMGTETIRISWTHRIAPAHRPIQQYTVHLRNIKSNLTFTETFEGNVTEALITGLESANEYSLAISADNLVGSSAIGPELRVSTLGHASTAMPQIEDVENATQPGCVNITWRRGETSQIEFRIMVHRLGSGSMREWYVRDTLSHSLCDLQPYSGYMLSLSANGPFGLSPTSTALFYTAESVPDDPPRILSFSPLSPTVLQVNWTAPDRPNGLIRIYRMYLSNEKMNQTDTIIRLNLDRSHSLSPLIYNITGLAPNLPYSIRISAATSKGEGPLSAPFKTWTPTKAPVPPRIENISSDCDNSVFISWLPSSSPSNGSSKAQKISFIVRLQSSVKAKILTFNTSNDHLIIFGLSPNERYSVQVAQREPLITHGSIESEWSNEEWFQLTEHCSIIQSSLCPLSTMENEGDNNHDRGCQPLQKEAIIHPSSSSSSSSSSSPFTFFLLFALIVFLCSTIFTTFFLRLRQRGTPSSPLPPLIQYFHLKFFLKKNKNEKKEKKKKRASIETIQQILYDKNEGRNIAVEDFSDYVEWLKRNENDMFKHQFEELQEKTTSQQEEEENDEVGEELNKNRYRDIRAPLSTRVRLNSSNSLYINANYVDGCSEGHLYIATQAPLPVTFDDFWTMIWQERSFLIVAITGLVENGRSKCDQYWPSLGCSIQFDSVHVSFVSESNNAMFSHRIFALRSNLCISQERYIHQLHMAETWPDHGVPDSVIPVLSLLHYGAAFHSTGPIVVHCSAGIGRSGAFILLDGLRRHLLNSSTSLNVMAYLRHIRRQRPQMVQTLEQFIFCHQVLIQLIRYGNTRLTPINALNEIKQRNNNYNSLFKKHGEDFSQALSSDNGPIVLPGYNAINEFLVNENQISNDFFWTEIWKTRRCNSIVLIDQEDTIENLKLSSGLTLSLNSGQPLQLTDGNGKLTIRVIQLRSEQLKSDPIRIIRRIEDQRLIGSTMAIVGYRARCLSLLMAVNCQLDKEGFIDLHRFVADYADRRPWTEEELDFIYDRCQALLNRN